MKKSKSQEKENLFDYTPDALTSGKMMMKQLFDTLAKQFEEQGCPKTEENLLTRLQLELEMHRDYCSELKGKVDELVQKVDYNMVKTYTDIAYDYLCDKNPNEKWLPLKEIKFWFLEFFVKEYTNPKATTVVYPSNLDEKILYYFVSLANIDIRKQGGETLIENKTFGVDQSLSDLGIGSTPPDSYDFKGNMDDLLNSGPTPTLQPETPEDRYKVAGML